MGELVELLRFNLAPKIGGEPLGQSRAFRHCAGLAGSTFRVRRIVYSQLITVLPPTGHFNFTTIFHGQSPLPAIVTCTTSKF